MKKLQIILHCLPREIDEVERICNHLQRSSHFLEKNDKVILDFTLNISDTLTDWKKSKLPKEFFIEKWKLIYFISLSFNYCHRDQTRTCLKWHKLFSNSSM